MPYMWSDTLLSVEKAHLLRLVLWGTASLVLGSTLLAYVRALKSRSKLLEHFAIQTAVWGGIEVALSLNGLRTLGLRDLTAATRLDRLVWLNIGLDAGYVIAGLTALAIGWRLARRPGLMGAGAGVVIQGAALAILDMGLAAQISR